MDKRTRRSLSEEDVSVENWWLRLTPASCSLERINSNFTNHGAFKLCFDVSVTLSVSRRQEEPLGSDNNQFSKDH